MRSGTWLALSAALLLTATGARAQDWPNWRGPTYNGAAEAKNLPVKFSPTQGVKWAASTMSLPRSSTRSLSASARGARPR